MCVCACVHACVRGIHVSVCVLRGVNYRAGDDNIKYRFGERFCLYDSNVKGKVGPQHLQHQLKGIAAARL